MWANQAAQVRGLKMSDLCKECGQELRVACPECGRMILVQKSVLSSHEKMTVHNGHITWGTCPKSNKGFSK
jgi:hypothetical protein